MFQNLTKNSAREEKERNLLETRTKSGPEKKMKKEGGFGEEVAWEKWVDSYFGRREKNLELVCNLMDTAWLCMPQLGWLHLLRLLWLPQVPWSLSFWTENQSRRFILRLSRGNSDGNPTSMSNWEPALISPHDSHLGNA